MLRVRPVVFDVGRVLKAPTEIAGYRLPAGVMVAPGIGLIHQRADRYPEPGRFDPDRMLGASLGPTTWLPFGGGNRRCLGATFALVEMKVVLREVLRRVELCTTTAASERQKVKHVILVPHRGARIRPDDPKGRNRIGGRGADADVPRSGGMASGLLATFAYVVFKGSLIGGCADFANDAVNTIVGVNIPWLVFATGAIVIIGMLCHFHISLTAAILGVAKSLRPQPVPPWAPPIPSTARRTSRLRCRP